MKISMTGDGAISAMSPTSSLSYIATYLAYVSHNTRLLTSSQVVDHSALMIKAFMSCEVMFSASVLLTVSHSSQFRLYAMLACENENTPSSLAEIYLRRVLQNCISHWLADRVHMHKHRTVGLVIMLTLIPAMGEG